MSIRVRLIPDDYHLPHVGRLPSGEGYWIDVQLDVEEGKTRDFIVTYVFDEDGRLVRHEIEDMGFRREFTFEVLNDEVESRLVRLGRTTSTDIWVHPFSVEAHGRTFGLVVRPPEDDGEEEAPVVDALPGWTLMFYPPWEEGLYDT